MTRRTTYHNAKRAFANGKPVTLMNIGVTIQLNNHKNLRKSARYALFNSVLDGETLNKNAEFMMEEK